jgi:hypothetical protein
MGQESADGLGAGQLIDGVDDLPVNNNQVVAPSARKTGRRRRSREEVDTDAPVSRDDVMRQIPLLEGDDAIRVFREAALGEIDEVA